MKSFSSEYYRKHTSIIYSNRNSLNAIYRTDLFPIVLGVLFLIVQSIAFVSTDTFPDGNGRTNEQPS